MKATNAASEPNGRRKSGRASSDRLDDERGAGKRNGVRARNR